MICSKRSDSTKNLAVDDDKDVERSTKAEGDSEEGGGKDNAGLDVYRF